MKRPRFYRARIKFRRALRRAPVLVKAGPEYLSRALADIRQTEYPLFVEPVLKQFRNRFKLGSRKAAEALPALDEISPDLSPATATDPVPEQNAPPTPSADQGQAAEALVDARLVEEIFARSTPPAAQPEEQHELGRWDASKPVTPTVALPERNGESNEELDGSLSEGADALEIGSDGPVETTSGVAVSDGITGTRATQPRPVDRPMVHTMVETFPDGPLDDVGLGDFLSGDLQDVFNTTNHADPLTKALLKGREQVDLRELADELKEYARSIGVKSAAPRKR